MDKDIDMEEVFLINNRKSIGTIKIRLIFESIDEDDEVLKSMEKECEEFLWELKKKYDGEKF